MTISSPLALYRSAASRIVSLIGVFFALSLALGRAHPVAQGSLDITIEPEAILAAFRVSNEQIFVASTFGERAAPVANLDEMWQSHASYLLAHVHLTAGEQAIPGELIRVEPPIDRTTNGFTIYTLRYPLSSPAPPQVSMRQSLLQEIEFAPGNPWEASFVGRVLKQGQTIEEAKLLGPKQPLDLPLASYNAAHGVAVTGSLARLAHDFFFLGLEHIFGGWDHILFVVALVFAVPRIGQVIALVTAFTFAHTITITLAVLRLVHLPSAFVEPMIAGSILVAAALNFFPKSNTSLKPRLVVAFGFGLFHGLGFAGALVDAMQSFSTRTLATAIASFSAGVEVGHQTVVIPLLIVMFVLRRWALPTVPWAARLGSAAVMIAGGWMLVLTLR